MSSSCLGGGGGGAGRAYAFDLDIVKQSPPSRSSHSSSSTISDTSNAAPLLISTKKPRTARKRPNQTYTEAAALLSKLYPSIFSFENLRKHCKFTKPSCPFIDTASDELLLLPPFPGLSHNGFLLPETPTLPEVRLFHKPIKTFQGGECFREVNSGCSLDDDEFDAESILDEEVGEGIDSIMGSTSNDYNNNNNNNVVGEFETENNYSDLVNPYLGHLVGRTTNMTGALRNAGSGEWWCSPTVEMRNIVPTLPKLQKSPAAEKKKKKKKVVVVVDLGKEAPATAIAPATTAAGEVEDYSSSSSEKKKVGLRPALSLKLNFEHVMSEWSGKGSPFSAVGDSSESPADIIAKLSDIDLLSEVAGSNGMREASVQRYKEKRRSRLCPKKIRYQVKKVNVDRRPRTKGKFSEEEEIE